MKKRKIKRWKKAQEAESQFYANVIRSDKFSEDFKYNPRAWDEGFRRFKFSDVTDKIILEIGSSVFGPIHYISKASMKVGIDPLVGKLFKEVASSDVYYLRSIGENLPFYKAMFDVVICNNVLDHTVEPLKVLGEAFRVLKPQGVLLLCVNVHPSAVAAFNPLLTWLDKEHPYHFEMNQVSDMIRSRGFRILNTNVVRSRLGKVLIIRLLKTAKLKALFGFLFLSMMYVKAKKIDNNIDWIKST